MNKDKTNTVITQAQKNESINEGGGTTKEILCAPLTGEDISISKIRLNLSLPNDIIIYVKTIASKNHQSLTGAIISMIMYYKMIHDFVKNDYKIYLEDPSGKNHYLLISTFV
jgi:hypothetical protein